MISKLFLALIFLHLHLHQVQVESKPIEPVPEEEIPAFRTLEIQNVPSELDRSGVAYKAKEIENTAFITSEDLKPLIPKKRKTKRKSKPKPKRKPKKMHLRRLYKTRLITTTPRAIMIDENRIDEETTTNIINLAPIYDAESGISYTQDELNRICTETVNLGQMSFYWQQGLQNQDTGQPTQQPQQQQGQWDFINLGGAPAPQHQWNSSAAQQQQQQNYYYQQQQQHNGPVHHYQAAGQQTQQQWAQHQHQTPTQNHHQVPQTNIVPQNQPPVIEHTPILHQPVLQQYPAAQTPVQTQTPPRAHHQKQQFNPAAPVFTPSHQQQYQQQHATKEPSPPQAAAQPVVSHQQAYFPPPPVAQLGSAPPSKEVTPEPEEVARRAAQDKARAQLEAQAKAEADAKAQAEQDARNRAEAEEREKFEAQAIAQARAQAQAQAAALLAQAQTQSAAPQQFQSYQTPLPAPPVLKPVVATIPAASNNVSRKDEQTTLTVAAPQASTEKDKTKITPTSSEDDWEKADMEVQKVDDEIKKSTPSTVPIDKPGESRESSSLGGSWSQQDTEPSERNSVEPVEILETPPTLTEEKGEKTPRVSMSENPEPTPVPLNQLASEERQETPDVRLETSLTFCSSPGDAIATSTPKDAKIEKRSSVSSQGTIHSEKEKTFVESKPKPDQLQEQEEGNNSDSTMASGKPDFERGHARASYREYKKTYLEICDRLKIIRTDSHHSDYRPSSKLANPLLAAAGLSRHPAIRRESTGGRNDGRASVPLPQSQSFSESPYPNGGRRSRVSRLDPNARPSSRQSGYTNAIYSNDPRLVNPYDQQRFVQQQNPRYHQGRYSAMGVPYRGYPQDSYDARRPQSTYMMEQFPNTYAQEPQETSSLSESEEEDENAESDEELQQYNMQNQSRRNHPEMQFHPPPVSGIDGEALYYCGVVHVNMDTWRRISKKFPIPAEFGDLDPIEKAAFMFYTVVYKQPYKDVDAFHKRFNREFYKYVCAGDSNDDALFKICRSMQDQYVARQQEKQAAYQQMKATLFSDDTSIDGQSEINSVYEESLNSCDTRNNGPLKFTHPHCFLNISTGGQIISINPEKSTSVVNFDDIKSLLKDLPTLQVKDAAQTFKGPLIPHHTPPHTVRLYISKQIENIKRSAVATENPEANDVVESLLVWQLLETMVKQQGNITGPDIAELLAKVANQPVNIEAPLQQSNITPALNQFTQFLLGGHIDEAVESAIRNGLFADALVLTRRLFPNDERRIEAIESRFLQTRSLSNPVTTLVSVAKGEAPPVLTNPPLDDHLSWRTHAAIILANLDQRGTAMNTIYQLGRALAKRDYHCAADFCFLVYCVLGGNNPFEPIQAPEGEEEYRRHISLVNSDIPDNESNPKCQYGFLLTDLHATEIFDYALRLKPDRESPLSKSVEYQTSRIKYAKLLANHGFNTDAYRYCTEIARSIWCHFASFNQDDLLELCDLAESLHFAACVDPADTQWIHDLRTMISTAYFQQPAQQQTAAQQQEPEVQNYEYQPEPVYEVSTEPLQPTPAPAYAEPSPAPTPVPSQHYQDENGYIPPTPTESVQQEAPVQQPDVPFVYQQHDPVSAPPQQQTFEDYDGFTTPPDYYEGPLTMASSPPVVNDPSPQHAQHSSQAPPQQAPQQPMQQTQTPPTTQLSQNQQAGLLKSIQNKIQQAIPGQNPMKLPEDKHPSIVWDPVQNKYVGNGVEQEPVAPPPPTMSAAPPTGIQGGGIRAARGASRYAQVSLGGSTNGASVPSGMPAPMPMPTTFGFMPAPVDDDADSADPFSGQANPTIQHSATQPADEK